MSVSQEAVAKRPSGRWRIFIALWLLVAMGLIYVSTNVQSTYSIRPGGNGASVPAGGHGVNITSSPPLDAATRLTNYINTYIAHMTLRAKIGQMIFAQLYDPYYDSTYQQFIQTIQPGGMIFYRPQIASVSMANALMSGMQHDSAIPMMLGADDEGGGIDNLDVVYPGKHPAAGDIADTLNTQYAYQQGAIMAQDTKSMGMNTDLAPVVDVPAPGGPTCAGGGYCRLWGNTPQMITQMAGAWMQGLQDSGVVGTLKHFPGLGEATVDPHKGLPVITESLAQIEQLDLAPYRALIDSKDPPSMIMSTDLLMTAIDPTVPAELSYKTITGVLRDELGYNGVVITDALYMDGVGIYFHANTRLDAPLAQACIQSILAGDDFLLGTYTPENTLYVVNAIVNAVQNGTITTARIDQSVRRILTLKARMGIWQPPITPPANPAQPRIGVVELPADVRPVA